MVLIPDLSALPHTDTIAQSPCFGNPGQGMMVVGIRQNLESMKLWEILLLVIPALALMLVCLPSLLRALGMRVGEFAFVLSTFIPLLALVIHCFRVWRLVRFVEHLESLINLDRSDNAARFRISDKYRASPTNATTLCPSHIKFPDGAITARRDLEWWGSFALQMWKSDSDPPGCLRGIRQWFPRIMRKYKSDDPLTAEEWWDLRTMMFWFNRFHRFGQEQWTVPLVTSVAAVELFLFAGLAFSLSATVAGNPLLQLLAGVAYVLVPVAWAFIGVVEDEFFSSSFAYDRLGIAACVGLSGIVSLVLAIIKMA